MKNKLKTYITILFILLGDIIAFYISFLFAYYTRKELFPAIFPHLTEPPFYSQYFRFSYLFLLFIGILIYHKLYIERRDFWAELKEVIKCSIVWIILSFALLSLLKVSTEASRIILLFTGIFSVLFLMLNRYFFKLILYKLNFFKLNSAIFIGNINNIKKVNAVIESINGVWYSGYKINSIIVYKSKQNFKLKNNISILNIDDFKKKKLFDVLKNNDISELFLYNVDDTLLEKILHMNIDNIIDVKYIPSFHYIKVLNLSIQNIGDNVALLFRNNLASKSNLIQKYITDLVIGSLLIVLLAPLFILIAMVVKITSPGPVFSQAKRIGKNYKDIYISKFRSMYQDADKRLKGLLASEPKLKKEFEATFKLKNDPRITKIGKFLRKYSLDELPQLFNVIKLELSLIGPRPIVKDEIKKYGKYFDEIIKVKPGVTGLWQVSGRSEVDYESRVRLDLFYIRNWSLWLDVKILLKTIPAVIRGRGAY